MENKENITDYLVELGFTRIFISNSKDDLDIDHFTCLLRIHVIHYLFYSELHKHFSIGVRHDNPKKDVTGRLLEWDHIMLPKIIHTIDDATKLLEGIL